MVSEVITRHIMIIDVHLNKSFIWITLMNLGDRLYAIAGEEMQKYSSPQNFRLNVDYPKQGGLGANITYVQIDVLQVYSS